MYPPIHPPTNHSRDAPRSRSHRSPALLPLLAILSLCNTVNALPTYEQLMAGPTLPVPYPGGGGALNNRDITLQPLLDLDFPDPSLLWDDSDGKYYSHATSSAGKHIQVAVASDPFSGWELLDVDALPGKGWTSGNNYWAPDVRRLDAGKYIMYFSGENPGGGGHCVGVARATNATGPFVMDDQPIACPRDRGGAIDASGFQDYDGRRYVVYKVDGSALPGGNTTANRTPLLLQEVGGGDGSTPIGDPVQLMDQEADDGGIVEAPSLIRLANGVYVLFFSANFFAGDEYTTKYAVSDSLRGPYVRTESALLVTGDFGLHGPGGATVSDDGSFMLFHGWCHGNQARCMYALRLAMT